MDSSDSCLPAYFNLLDRNFIQKIKTVWFSGSKAVIVTNSDEVFGFGHLPDYKLYQNILEPRRIPYLNNIQMKKFVIRNESVVALTEDGRVFSWNGDDTMLSMHENVIDVACNSSDILELCEDDLLYTWGNQTGYDLRHLGTIKEITPTKHAHFYLTSNGEVYGKGYLFSGPDSDQYTIGNDYVRNVYTSWTKINSLNNIIKIVGGKDIVIALDGDGVVFVWGRNANHELTNSLEKYQPRPIKMPNIPKKIIDIAAHRQSGLSAVMAADSKIYVWGIALQIAVKGLFEPVLTSFTSFNEVFVKLSNPSLSLEPVMLNAARSIKNCNKSLESIFDIQEDSDFTISVEGRSIFVHKVILKANSKYFHAMFTNQWKESKKNVLKLDGYSYKSFRSFLLYLYTGEIDVTPENVFELMNIADKYVDEELSALIKKKVKSGLISEGIGTVVEEIMKLSSPDYEIFCSSMKKWMTPSTSELVD